MKKSEAQVRARSTVRAKRTQKSTGSAAKKRARISSITTSAKQAVLRQALRRDRENEIMRLGVTATRHASRLALASGLSITIAKENQVIKISPGGQRTVIKDIAPDVMVHQRQMRLK